MLRSPNSPPAIRATRTPSAAPCCNAARRRTASTRISSPPATQLGGALNFPRRVATAYFNCAVWRLYNQFATAVERALAGMGLGHVKVNMLKADGGTMPLPRSRRMPVQSIFSGPAASVMGIIALTDIFHDSVILDIGGTTTDIAIFADGAPLIEREGIAIGSHPTLVPALKVLSIGIGGDSAISVSRSSATVRVGPQPARPVRVPGRPAPHPDRRPEPARRVRRGRH